MNAVRNGQAKPRVKEVLGLWLVVECRWVDDVRRFREVWYSTRAAALAHAAAIRVEVTS